MPVHVTPVRRAIAMVFASVAHAIDTESFAPRDFRDWLAVEPDLERAIRTSTRWIAVPEVVQLRRYDRVPAFEAPFTRTSLLRRDDHRCQYCGSRPPSSQLTIDHVVPRAQGGRTSWDNCVAACVRCNSRKGDRSPAHAGLRLLRPPRAPRWTPYSNVRPHDWPDSWSRFMPRATKTGS